ncbi:MAG: arylamine N-acetyltransferase [Coriobacteriales bacterium]|jgi:N-hydroxyarylamine O-acetyltransferase|nr:arylamine N-acetyltransferase [Coriobacteriales bacterium]
MLSETQVEKYLCRIGLVDGVPVSATGLAVLHRQHLLTVPFDNLDVLAHLPEIKTLEGLFEKIVKRRRGGICYELNALFAELLRALGFTVRLAAARPSARAGVPSCGEDPDFAHLILLVHVDQDLWLADVGFGRGGFFEPLRFTVGLSQTDQRGTYRIVPSTAEGVKGCYDLLFTPRFAPKDVSTAEQERVIYRFDPTARDLSEFSRRWHWTVTSSDSLFLSGSLVALDTPAGRISLSENHLRITEYGRQTARAIPDTDGFHALLAEHFGIIAP